MMSFVLFQCTSTETSEETEGLLATVNNKSLYISDLENMIASDLTPQDSALAVNAYVDRWIKEILMLQEAEINLPKDLNLDQLVRDYRASLILHNYEKILVEEQLDSMITEEELSVYYEKNKEQYQLDNNIVRCIYIKVLRNAPQTSSLKRWWEDEDYESLRTYCAEYAESYSLDENIWIRVDELAAEFPKSSFNFRDTSKDLTLKNNKYRYFLRILEYKSQKEIAPLNFIKEQATKYILHNRKLKLLEQKKDELYEKGIRRNNVKIVTR